jgi:hypothetical protein
MWGGSQCGDAGSPARAEVYVVNIMPHPADIPSRNRADDSSRVANTLSYSSCHGLWRSLVAHLTGGQGVAGSNPVSPTNAEEAAHWAASSAFRRPYSGVPAAPVPAHRGPRGSRLTEYRDVTAVPVGRSPTNVMSRVVVHRCLGSSFTIGSPAGGCFVVWFSHLGSRLVRFGHGENAESLSLVHRHHRPALEARLRRTFYPSPPFVDQ